MSGLSGVLADFVLEASNPAPAQADEDPVLRALLDTIGCAAAVAREGAYEQVRAGFALEMAAGRSTVWLGGGGVSAASAAFLNGTAAHLAELDDAAPSVVMHASAVLVSALLALAEDQGASWAELRAAYEVGAAACRAIASALPNMEHYAHGWHTTATVGTLAAACAAGRLAGLSSAQLRHALGIAASMSGGLRANVGSTTKALHAGLAARNGVLAAMLGRAGVSASPTVLEDPNGFFAAYGSGPPPSASDFGKALRGWLRDWKFDATVKQYPSCYATHRAADALCHLHAAGLRPGEVERVDLCVHPGGTLPLFAGVPATDEQARFSLEFVAATALVDGEVSLGSFSAARRARPAIADLMARVAIRESAVPEIGPSSWRHGFVTAIVTTRDGGEYRERRDITHGSGRDPLTWDELRQKFSRCAAHGGLPWYVDPTLASRIAKDGQAVRFRTFVAEH